MILEKETFEEFGYYPNDLSYGSSKQIVCTCDDCGKKRKVRKHSYHSLCSSCARKKEHLSIETRDKISKSATNRKGVLNPNWKGGEVECICQQCGKHFSVQQNVIKQGWGKFCSRKCKDNYLSEHTRGKNSPHWKGGKVERICEICGAHFFVFLSQIKRGSGKHCSYICARKARRFQTHHTKPELIFEDICKKHDLHFKYTGDGAFWIGKNPSINPDFVDCNGKKIAVEIFGDYWHSPLLNKNIQFSRTYIGRNKILKEYGWKLVVFWGTDLLREDAEQFILNKLKGI